MNTKWYGSDGCVYTGMSVEALITHLAPQGHRIITKEEFEATCTTRRD